MISKQRWVYTCVAFFLACEPRIDVGVADAGTQVKSEDAGIPDAGPQVTVTDAGIPDAGTQVTVPDAGIPDGGFAELSGSRAFVPKTVRALGFASSDGGIDESRLTVMISDIELPCVRPTQQFAGPGTVIVLDADTEPGIEAKGSFSSDGSNMYIGLLAFDGGIPNFDFIAQNAGSFVIEHDPDISLGVTGSFDLKTSGGETINGTFRASYCPPSP